MCVVYNTNTFLLHQYLIVYYMFKLLFYLIIFILYFLASIPIVVCLISLPILGILMDKIGRKYTLIITYVPMIISWIIFVYSNSFEALLISKIILGFSYSKFFSYKLIDDIEYIGIYNYIDST